MRAGRVGPALVAAAALAVVLPSTGCGAAVPTSSGTSVVAVGGSAGTAAGASAATGTSTRIQGPPEASTGSAWRASLPDVAGSSPSVAGESIALWPFTNSAQVQAWIVAEGAKGHQAWHLDPARTAMNFAEQYLGYAGMDQVVSQVFTGRRAQIGIGWDDVGAETPGREAGEVGRHRAAVVHLIRYGSGDHAPWVVVGADDDGLVIDGPTYGATAFSPLAVNGRLTRMDGSLQIKVLAGSTAPLTQVDGITAAGTSRAWSTRLTFAAPHGSVLTVAVSVGGHRRAVERFAITVVRVA
jgi:hypothetical protein